MGATDDPVRALVRERIAATGINMAEASRRIGKNSAYVQQFLERGSPARLPEDVRERLADVLGTESALLRPAARAGAEKSAGALPVRINGMSSRDKMAVLGGAQGGPDGQFQMNGQPIDYVPRPPYLIDAREAYALYVDGESMAPRYERGELIYVHPGKPVTVGAYVVAQIRNPHGDVPLSYLKRLSRRSGGKVVLEQFNPKKTLEFKTDDVVTLHRVVGSGDY